jgi:TonB-dependent receptor
VVWPRHGGCDKLARAGVALRKDAAWRFRNSASLTTPMTTTTRRSHFIVGASLLFLLSLASALAQATGTLTGRVLDATTKSALRGAEVTATAGGTSVRTATDTEGAFTLTLPAGAQQVTVDYLGLAPKSATVTIAAGATARQDFTLGDATVTLEAFTVADSRTGQARALNQQRAAQNLTNIISADFTGQFPDKTIADAVKRLPGITVETDRDTGGVEGRYITVRGMSADFNAVTIDGVRVNVTDFDGITRRVPLDVVSSDVADQIEVTKALRPDQDADSIGGAVNIRTRSAFSRAERSASLKAAVSYAAMLEEYTGGYPYENPGYEASVTYSDLLGTDRTFGLSLAANWRERTFVKQRNSTTGWNDTAGYRAGTATTPTPLRGYVMDSFVLQHFHDDIQSHGLNGSLEWRPVEAHKLRLFASTNARETNRGRQRQVIFFPLGRASDNSIPTTTAPTLSGDTYATVSSSGNTVRREVRDFEELQKTSTVALDGESRIGDYLVDYVVGYNFAKWDGGGDSALTASFQNAGFVTSYALTPGDAQFPVVNAVQTTTGRDRNDPAVTGVYTMRTLNVGTRFYDDDELNAAMNVRRNTTVGDWNGFVKTGAKVRSRSRDFDNVAREYNQTTAWSLLGYTGQTDIGSLLADYRAKSTIDGRYDYGYFLDPARVRAATRTLLSRGLLTPLSTNDFNSLYNDYKASEDITSGYGMAQLARGKWTLLGGIRVEHTSSKFETYRVTDGTPTAIAPRRKRTDWLPGFHARYDLSRKTTLRASYTETLARPTFSQLNPRETRSTTSDTISRGNINLKPVYSRNYDLSVEHYLGADNFVSVGVFHKDYKNNVYRSTQNEIFEGELNRITEPRNARGGEVTGVEFAFDQRLTFLPAPFDGFGITLNYTNTDSELDSGLPALAGIKMPLFDQVSESFNASLRYERGRFRSRLSLHHRGDTLFDLATDAAIAVGRYEAPSTTLDFTASYRLNRGFSVFIEFANLTNEPSWGYNGDKNIRLDYNEYSDWSGVFGVRWNL